jgi:hypothetical protein
MSFVVLFFSFLSIAPAQSEEPAPVREVDVSAVRDQLRVFKAENEHILVLVPFSNGDAVFWGKPNDLLYRQEPLSSSADRPESYSISLIDRRYPRRGYSIQYPVKERTTVVCGPDHLALSPMDLAEGEELLKGAQFVLPFWKRSAHFLARDDYGVYYFIDKANYYDDTPIPESSYRVFIGWKGEILQSPLKMVAQDSVGEVYGMTNGNRRVVINQGVGRYFDGDEVRVLHTLNLYADSQLMYRDNKIYGNARHGTPCDSFFAQ